MNLRNLGQIAVVSALLSPVSSSSVQNSVKPEIIYSQGETNSAVNGLISMEASSSDDWESKIEENYQAGIDSVRQNYPGIVELVQAHAPEVLENPKLLMAGTLGSSADIKSFAEKLGWDGFIALLLIVFLAGVIGFGRASRQLEQNEKNAEVLREVNIVITRRGILRTIGIGAAGYLGIKLILNSINSDDQTDATFSPKIEEYENPEDIPAVYDVYPEEEPKVEPKKQKDQTSGDKRNDLDTPQPILEAPIPLDVNEPENVPEENQDEYYEYGETL